MRKMIRRTGAGLLSAVLLFGMIPVSVPAVAAGETITIASEEDLIALSENCRLDIWSRGKTVELTEDLDLRGCDYKAIPSFGGVFKGNGHTIRGLNIGDGDEKDVVTENGLFLAIQKGGEVRDIKLTIKMDSAESDILGGIAASNSGSIYGCEVEGNIHGNNYIGGIVGKNEHDGTIRKCTSLCTVNGRTYTGGIAGDNAGTITECVNEGRINITDEGGDIDAANLSKIDFSHILSATNTSLATDTGGIAGYSEGEISSCENHADIGYPHVGYNVGGIVGRQAGYLTGCKNDGKIVGRKDVGGICGQCVPSISLNFDNSNMDTLREEFGKLDGLMDNLKNDAGSGIGGISSSLDKMSGYITSAKNSAESLASSVSGDVGAAAADAKQKASDLKGYTSDIKNATSDLKGIVSGLDSAVTDCKDTIRGLTGEYKQAANAAIGTIESGVKQIRQGYDSLKKGEGMLISDPKGAISQVKSGVSDLSAGIKSLKNGVDALDKVRSDLEESGDSQQAASSIKNLVSTFQSSENSADAALSNISSVASQISGGAASVSSGVDTGSYKKNVQGIASAIGGIGESLNSTKNSIKNSSSKIIRDFEKVSSEFTAIVNMFGSMVDDTMNTNFLSKDTYLADISDDAIFSAIDGKTAESVNRGDVEADVNVGGIAGTMAVEYDMDPEDDIDVSGKTGIHFEYQTKVIVFRNKNYGDILGKKDCVGSVIGNMDVGTVYGCEAYGTAESETGDYVGGVAGKSVSAIKKSYAKCALAGRQYVGGIVGEGENISDSCSLARVDRADAFSGAIAGKAGGKVKDNYFTSETLTGIDRTSYKGKAEPLSFNDLCKIKGVPSGFRTMTATFMAEGKEVGKQTFTYGGSLNESEIPEVPKKSGYYGKWSEDNFENLTLDVIATAEYEPYLTVLASEQTREEQSILLVTGQFTDASGMTVEEAGDGVSGASETYQVHITGDSEVESVRFLPEGGKDCTLYMKSGDGAWKEITADNFGKSKEFETTEKDFGLSVVMKPESHTLMIVLIAAGAVIVLILVVAVAKRIKKKSKKA